MEKVSVIIPVYNAEKTVESAIESVLTQSYPNIELIIVDDGSTDRSGEICSSICQSDKRIFVIHTLNHGASGARNTGLQRANGRFLMFVDADDLLLPDAIHKMVNEIGNCEMACGAFWKISDSRFKLSDAVGYGVRDKRGLAEFVMKNLKDPSRNQLLSGCWAKLYRLQIIRAHNIQFPENQSSAEDMTFNFSYLKHCQKVLFMDTPIYENHKHHDFKSLSTRFNPNEPFGMFGFRSGIAVVREFLGGMFNQADIDRAIGQSYVYHTILAFVRICGQSSGSLARGLIRAIISEGQFKRYARAYRPAKGNYRLIPWLLRLGWVWPIMLACKWKARKVYR